MAATRFRAGKNSLAQVGAAQLALTDWSSNYSGDLQPTNNFESNGQKEGLMGFVGLDWTLKGNWDATADALTDPPGLFPRDDGANMQLVTNVADGSKFSLPLFICTHSTIGASATGLVTFDSAGSSQGPFQTP